MDRSGRLRVECGLGDKFGGGANNGCLTNDFGCAESCVGYSQVVRVT